MSPRKITSPIKASTQDFIEIETVKNDILLLKNYSACTIVNSGTVNFTLLSEDEQSAIIYSYASLLNSLSFPVQILILSKKMDISSYLKHIDIKINLQINSNLKQRLLNYQEFIKNIVKKNTMLEKKFYFVIPFSPLEMGIAGVSKKNFTKEYVVARAKISLYPKRDHLLRLLKKANLNGRILYEQEIIELFYNLYNPSSIGRKLGSPVKSYGDVILTQRKNGI